MQPLERYQLDAAILFSDILTIPDAMDCGLYFEAGEGPRFERPVRTRADIDALPVPSMARCIGLCDECGFNDSSRTQRPCAIDWILEALGLWRLI